MEQGSFAALNGTVLPKEQGWEVETPQESGAFPSVHRAAGQGQAGI